MITMKQMELGPWQSASRDDDKALANIHWHYIFTKSSNDISNGRELIQESQPCLKKRSAPHDPTWLLLSLIKLSKHKACNDWRVVGVIRSTSLDISTLEIRSLLSKFWTPQNLPRRNFSTRVNLANECLYDFNTFLFTYFSHGFLPSFWYRSRKSDYASHAKSMSLPRNAKTAPFQLLNLEVVLTIQSPSRVCSWIFSDRIGQRWCAEVIIWYESFYPVVTSTFNPRSSLIWRRDSGGF
jgi:hypothetical protein